MRIALLVTLSLVLHAVACGGSSTRRGTRAGEADAGGAGDSGAGHVCPDPTSSVPDAPPFQPPAANALGSFHVTFQNRCVTTVWPAWAVSGGLDNSVIDTQIWFPMAPASERTVTVYGGVREIGFWGRTACTFDQQGVGSCGTGDCFGFICPNSVNNFPPNATVFDLQRGFLGGYNLGLRVEGAACGKHECVAELGTCAPVSTENDSCGGAVACHDICSEVTPECCRQSGSRCDSAQMDRDTGGMDDLVITFCP